MAHSRPLDVHRWSDHEEVNGFVDRIYKDFISPPQKENIRIKKKHLKVVLLDLYIAWLEDPELNIAVHMRPSAYSNGTIFSRGKSRYNELNIKVSTIEIVHRLHSCGLIGFHKGFEGSAGWHGYLSRIWPLSELIQFFKQASFNKFYINYSKNRETIILRNSEKKEIEYEDNRATNEMRALVEKYNSILERAFIDIPTLDKPIVELPNKHSNGKKRKSASVNISHHDKFVRRIFNNSSFSQGGRFYGGWWQRIDSQLRKEIRINNIATVEIDYSSLHVVLAYAKEGMDYWQSTDQDPYDLPIRGVSDKQHQRSLCKLFILLSLNASKEQSLFKAFRSELNYEEYPYKFTDGILAELLNTIKFFHSKISHLICTGAGLELMNTDSRICEYIIREFLKTNTPILTVHDSFIVQVGAEDRLHDVMGEAVEVVTSLNRAKFKYNDNLTKAAIYSLGAHDRDWKLDMLQYVANPVQTAGYQSRWRLHKLFYVNE